MRRMNWADGDAPKGWKLRQLGDVAKVVGGGTPKTGIVENFAEEAGHPWITPADMTGYTDKYVARGKRFLTDQGLATSSAKVMPAGTVLFSSRAPIGYVAIASNPVTTNQGFRSLVPSDEIDSEYLYYAMQFLRPLAEQLASGTTFPEISGSKLAQLPIAYPALASQRAIAQVLDGATSHQRNTASHITTAYRAIERFGQAVLDAEYRHAVEEGDERLLEELLDEPLRNGYSARPVNAVTPFRVLTLTATTSGWFDDRQFKYTAEKFSPDSRFWVRNGDILIQRGNTAEYVGVPALYEGPDRAYLFPDLMIRARARRDIGARYVWYMLLSPQLRNLVRSQATGSAGNMPKVNQTILNAIPIPVPDERQRAAIVSRLDVAFEITRRLTAQLKAASRHVERSAQAVLVKAFQGELLANAELDTET